MSKPRSKKRQIAQSKLQSPAVNRITEPSSVVIAQQKQEFYSGSLPHPEHLARFEEISPGLSNRLMALVEKEQQAANETIAKQLELQGQGITFTAADNRRKSYLAFAALVVCLATSLGLAALHAFTASGIVGGTTVLGVVASFLQQHRRNKKEK